MPELAIVVVSYNSSRWLERCLTTAYDHAGETELEIVVVDNDSTDGSADLVERLFPEATVLRCPNQGFAYGNNRAFALIESPFVLFLNADTEILKGTFSELLEDLRRRPKVGLVGVRQLDADGGLNPTIRRFPNARRLFFEAVGSERFPFRASWLGERELDPEAYERDTECDWTSGSFMLARREAVLGAGLMDERFFMYCEEPDLCLRIKGSGWEVRHLPTMTIRHYARKAGWDPQLVAQDAFARRQYMSKHFSGVPRVLAMTSFALGLALRAAIGARQGDARRARRAASVAALRTFLGFAPPPFRQPPPVAVAPIDVLPAAPQR